MTYKLDPNDKRLGSLYINPKNDDEFLSVQPSGNMMMIHDSHVVSFRGKSTAGELLLETNTEGVVKLRAWYQNRIKGWYAVSNHLGLEVTRNNIVKGVK